jgi:hypothetical protein
MNLNHSHEAHNQPKPSHRQNVKTRTQLREGADAMLCDIAFVLKMTQKVRSQMDAGKENCELALV